jgi:actin-related protein
MEASSMEEYLLLIQKRTDEITKSFHECIQILAEEQRIARQWRLKNQRLEKRIEKLVQKIEELQTLNENGTRIQVAFPNVNENADIVKTVKYKAKNFPSLDESKSFKEDCIKLVVVPTLKRAVGLP